MRGSTAQSSDAAEEGSLGITRLKRGNAEGGGRMVLVVLHSGDLDAANARKAKPDHQKLLERASRIVPAGSIRR